MELNINQLKNFTLNFTLNFTHFFIKNRSFGYLDIYLKAIHPTLFWPFVMFSSFLLDNFDLNVLKYYSILFYITFIFFILFFYVHKIYTTLLLVFAVLFYTNYKVTN